MTKEKKANDNERINSQSGIFYATLSSKNQITVPARIREKLDARPGDQMVYTLNDDDQIMVDIIKKDSLLSLFGSMPPKGSNTQKKWHDIREEARNERFESFNKSLD